MAVTESSYYSFTRVRETSPEAQDWATVDHNWDLVSKILKAFEAHAHTGVASIAYPGYNDADPENPTLPTLTERTDQGGILQPGVTVGVRLSYVNSANLETESVQEVRLPLSAATDRPLTPELVSTQVALDAIPGGSYIYGITKGKGSGETLISDVLPVDITYDDTYSVTLQFEAINTYSDGTDAIHIYRSTGLDSSFQKVAVITDPATTQFTDTNDLDPALVETQPPSTSTFDATRSVRIDWSALTHPTGADRLYVYVTQDEGLWGTEHLLQEVDLSGVPDTFTDYLGTEILGSGWPKESSQIPSAPPKLNLTSEAEGGVQATDVSDFSGNALNNVKFGDAPTVALADGMLWYDSTANQFKGRVGGASVTLAQAGASFSHGAEEPGGHIADNIPHVAASTTSVKDILDYISDGTTGTRKQVQAVSQAIGVVSDTTTSTSPVDLDDMALSVTPDFDNQWVEINFSGHFTTDVAFSTLSIALEVDGTTVEETTRSYTFPTIEASIPFDLSHTLQLADDQTAYSINVLWWVSSGTATAVDTRRVLTTKKVF